MRTRIVRVAMAAAVVATFSVANGRAQDQPNSGAVTVMPSVGGLVWVINVPYELAKLRVSGPTGSFKGAFQAEMPALEGLPDGNYHYELWVFPARAENNRSAAQAAPGTLVSQDLTSADGREPINLNGSFAVQGGAVVLPDMNQTRK